MARPPALSTALLLMAFCAVVLILLFSSPQAEGETYTEVELYLSGQVASDQDGDLEIQKPGGTSFTSAAMDTNSSGPNQFTELGTWLYPRDLTKVTNLSGSWSMTAWVFTDQDIALDLRVTLRKSGGDITTLLAEKEIAGGSDTEVTVSGNMDTEEWDINPIEIYLESRWDPPQNPPIGWQAPSELELRYDAASYRSRVSVTLDLVDLSLADNGVNHIDEDTEVKITVMVESPFGQEPLSDDPRDYEMTINWEDEEAYPMPASTQAYQDGRKVNFEWDYGGRSLPPGTHSYSVSVLASDALTSQQWETSFTISLYIQEVPGLEVDPGNTVERNVNPGKFARYSFSVANPGTAEAEINLSLSSPDIPGWSLTLSKYDFTLAAGDDLGVTLTVTAPQDAQEDEQEMTMVTASTLGDEELEETMEFTTTVIIPPASYGMGLKLDNDYLQTSWDMEPVEFQLTITNQGNRRDTFYLTIFEKHEGLSYSFSPPTATDLDPEQQLNVILTATPKPDLAEFVSKWPAEIDILAIATSKADDSRSKDISMLFEGRFSGNILLDETEGERSIRQDSSGSGEFTIQNLKEDTLNLYFQVTESGESLADSSRTLSKIKFYFYDEDGDEIDDRDPLVLSSMESADVTYRVVVTSSAKLGDYSFDIQALDDDDDAVSSISQLSVSALEAEKDDEFPVVLIGGVALAVVAILGALMYFKPWSRFDDDEDDLVPVTMEASVGIIPETLPEAASLPAELPSTLGADDSTWAKPTEPRTEPTMAPVSVDETSQPIMMAPATPENMAQPVPTTVPAMAQPVPAAPEPVMPQAALPSTLPPPVVAAPLAAPAPVAQAMPAEVPASVAAVPAQAAVVSAQPVAVAATPVAAQPVAVAPQPAVVAAAPVAVTAQPVAVAAQPVAVEAQPAVVAAQPVVVVQEQ